MEASSTSRSPSAETRRLKSSLWGCNGWSTARLRADTISRQGESAMKGATLGFWTIVIAIGVGGVGTWLPAPTHAQGKGSGDWVSHNFDRQNSRFSPLDQINT